MGSAGVWEGHHSGKGTSLLVPLPAPSMRLQPLGYAGAWHTSNVRIFSHNDTIHARSCAKISPVVTLDFDNLFLTKPWPFELSIFLPQGAIALLRQSLGSGSGCSVQGDRKGRAASFEAAVCQKK
jgi:hypothetical protein